MKAWRRSRDRPLEVFQGGNLEELQSGNNSFPPTVHHPLVSTKSQQPQVDNSVLCVFVYVHFGGQLEKTSFMFRHATVVPRHELPNILPNMLKLVAS